jgi:hypothetical protein
MAGTGPRCEPGVCAGPGSGRRSVGVGSDADCRTSAIGAKACGGPEAYIAWSARSTDEVALNAVLADYNAAQRAAIVREGRVSNCAFVTDPGAACVASGSTGGNCRLRQRPRGHGGQRSRQRWRMFYRGPW